MPAVCFRHDDGHLVLILLNEGNSSRHTTAGCGNDAFSYTIPPASAVTFCWDNGVSVSTQARK